MSADRHPSPDVFERVHRFAVASLNDELTEDLVADLERLLLESDEACRLYIQYVDTTLLLPRVLGGLGSEKDSEPYEGIAPLSPPVVSAVIDAACPPPPPESPSPLEPEEYGLPPVPGFSPLSSTLRKVTQIGVLPYLACASLLVLASLAVQLMWEEKGPDRGEMAQPAPVMQHFEEVRPVGVGQITGIDGCRWAEGMPRSTFFDRVRIGQKLHLEAGLVEITYDTGFQTILQGPVEYEVTSASGGFLTVGRLTGKATTERARGFTVHTPTAAVTDLGTEFGAEVARDGRVETVVFSGEVKLTATTAEGPSGSEQVLRAGQAAQVVSSAGQADPANPPPAPIVEVIEAIAPERFARSVPPPPERVLISASQGNGSFEQPVVGPSYFDAEASDPALRVYAKAPGATPPGWNPTYALRTKGTVVRGVTGEQYVMLQGVGSILSTRFDGKGNRPAARLYEPHTIYVLTADIGGNRPGVRASVAFEDGMQRVGHIVMVSEPDAMEAMPALALNTDERPNFVGKPISVSFMNMDNSQKNKFYVDNVVLRALPVEP
jgi:hypothetical protein